MKKLKTVRPRNWLYELLVLLEGLLIFALWWLILGSRKQIFLCWAITYLALAWTLRGIFQRHHRRGMKLLRRKKFSEAAVSFQNSFHYFASHPRIDKYRFITMFSSNAISFQHMALNNLGICFLHLGRNQEALETFENLAGLNGDIPNLQLVIEALRKHIQEAESSAAQ